MGDTKGDTRSLDYGSYARCVGSPDRGLGRQTHGPQGHAAGVPTAKGAVGGAHSELGLGFRVRVFLDPRIK